jgi:hypothetical protein
VTSRTAFLLGAFVVATVGDLVLYRHVRVSAEINQDLSTRLATHRCPAPVRPDFATTELYEYVPGAPLVQPPPMRDPAIAKSPITLGRPQ